MRIDENFLAEHNSAYAAIVITAMTVLIENAYNHLASLSPTALNLAQEDAIWDTFSIEALEAAVVNQTAVIDGIAQSAITFYRLVLRIRLVLEIDQAGIESFVAMLQTATGWSTQMCRDYVESWIDEIEDCRMALGPVNKIAYWICLLRDRLEFRALVQRGEINNRYSEDEDEDDEEDDENIPDQAMEEEDENIQDQAMEEDEDEEMEDSEEMDEETDEEVDQDHENHDS